MSSIDVSNDDIVEMLHAIRSFMATKSDLQRLQDEVALLRSENMAQSKVIRCMRTEALELRMQVDEMRVQTREDVLEGIEQVKEDVARWGISTQDEIWEGNRKIGRDLQEIDAGVGRLEVDSDQTLEDAVEMSSDLQKVLRRIDGLEKRMENLQVIMEEQEKESSEVEVEVVEEEDGEDDDDDGDGDGKSAGSISSAQNKPGKSSLCADRS